MKEKIQIENKNKQTKIRTSALGGARDTLTSGSTAYAL